ncbi:copper homeostasis protein CutC [Paenibacillaceae bacterium]|nr:copper homeostasis protein CutC [Paenibacillaceae bacterium]
MLLEVIATSVLDAKLAEEGGAGRIELISGICEGGVTPSLGLIERVVKSVSIPVNVMVRPHANSFCYDEDDLLTMIRDIQEIRRVGAAGIVLGTLTPAGEVDEAALQRLLEVAGDLSVTFHRAFDEVEDQQSTLRLLSGYRQIDRILTSGGQRSALDAVEPIRQLNRLGEELSIKILAGSGLTIDALPGFIQETGVSEVHLGTGVRSQFAPLQPIDPQLVRAAAAALAKADQ